MLRQGRKIKFQPQRHLLLLKTNSKENSIKKKKLKTKDWLVLSMPQIKLFMLMVLVAKHTPRYMVVKHTPRYMAAKQTPRYMKVKLTPEHT